MGPVSATQDTDERRATVLLVEDELLLRWPTGEYLRDAGYRVIEAATASEAIAVLSSGTPIDLVFSDINLTDAMSGHALAGWLASNRPQVPMLLTSADRGELGRVAVDTLRAVLTKPYDLSAAAERIRQMLSQR
jgi:two-component system, response regulator PdtaR